MKDKLSFAHCVHELEDMDEVDLGRMVSLGGSIAMIK